jgi:hypothetical protein
MDEAQARADAANRRLRELSVKPKPRFPFSSQNYLGSLIGAK